MRRRLLNRLALLSLLLCVAVVVVWVRSYSAFRWVKLTEAALSPSDANGERAYETCIFSWHGHLGYVRSRDFYFQGSGFGGSFPLAQPPASLRDEAQNAESLYLIHDLERRWMRGASVLFDVAGVRYVVHDQTWPGGLHLVVPFGLLFALTSLPAAAWGGVTIRRQFAVHRVPQPGCGSCGYDLTGNISGVCPECGKPA